MSDFYNKEENPEYYKKYESEHAARIDWIIEHFSMKLWTTKSILDVGCGTGYFLNSLHFNNSLYGIDGSNICEKLKRYFKFKQINLNLEFAYECWEKMDVVTCFETLEHIPNLYNCIKEIKGIGKIDADIYLSIPHESVTHNTLYPALFYPETNFEQFLSQMALPIVEKIHCTQSFPTWVYHCKNRHWSEKQLKWPKSDERFKDMDILGVINN